MEARKSYLGGPPPLDGVKQSKPDAIMLGLHGAMAVENYEDGEGELLRRWRAGSTGPPD